MQARPKRRRGWPYVIGLLFFNLFLLVVGSFIVPAQTNVPQGYEAGDWWFRAIAALIFVIVAWRSGIAVHRSNWVPWQGLIVVAPVLLMIGGAVMCVLSGMPRADLLPATFASGVFVGIYEEILTRGLILNALLGRLKVLPAVLSTSVLFAAMHLLGGNPLDALIPFFLGICLSWIYVMSGRNLWLVVAIHAVYNITLGFMPLSNLPIQLGVYGGVALMMVSAVVLTVLGARRWWGQRLDEVLIPSGHAV